MIRNSRPRARGFTLIELMIVVAIVGILAVLSVGGVHKYVTQAKTVEAHASVGQIGRHAAMAYERDNGTTTTLNLGTSGASMHGFCASSQPVPAAGPPGPKKYQSSTGDWRTGDQKTGWQCLKFSMEAPQYFQLSYTNFGTTFQATAHGDLDGDGIWSSFTLNGGTSSGVVVLAPNIREVNPDE